MNNQKDEFLKRIVKKESLKKMDENKKEEMKQNIINYVLKKEQKEKRKKGPIWISVAAVPLLIFVLFVTTQSIHHDHIGSDLPLLNVKDYMKPTFPDKELTHYEKLQQILIELGERPEQKEFVIEDLEKKHYIGNLAEVEEFGFSFYLLHSTDDQGVDFQFAVTSKNKVVISPVESDQEAVEDFYLEIEWFEDGSASEKFYEKVDQLSERFGKIEVRGFYKGPFSGESYLGLFENENDKFHVGKLLLLEEKDLLLTFYHPKHYEESELEVMASTFAISPNYQINTDPQSLDIELLIPEDLNTMEFDITGENFEQVNLYLAPFTDEHLPNLNELEQIGAIDEKDANGNWKFSWEVDRSKHRHQIILQFIGDTIKVRPYYILNMEENM